MFAGTGRNHCPAPGYLFSLTSFCVTPSPTPFFCNAAATVTYVPAGYIRLDWQPVPAPADELRAVYEQVLLAMQHHGTSSLMTVHNNRPPVPPEVQAWLGENWVPRALREVGYGRCAVVEAEVTLSRQSVRAVGSSIEEPLEYQFFSTPEAADAWLQGS
jgi:hypothetical protein